MSVAADKLCSSYKVDFGRSVRELPEQDFLLEQTLSLLGQVMAGPVGTAMTALVTAGNST